MLFRSQIVDEIAAINPKPVIRFAALVHDLGKGLTPEEMLPHHYEHDRRGVDVLNEMSTRIRLPSDWKKIAAFVIREHMRAPVLSGAGKIIDLLIKIHNSKIAVADFNDIIRTDHHGLPNYLANAETILAEILKVSGKSAPPELKGAEIGDWIRAERIRRFVAIRRALT